MALSNPTVMCTCVFILFCTLNPCSIPTKKVRTVKTGKRSKVLAAKGPGVGDNIRTMKAGKRKGLAERGKGVGAGKKKRGAAAPPPNRYRRAGVGQDLFKLRKGTAPPNPPQRLEKQQQRAQTPRPRRRRPHPAQRSRRARQVSMSPDAQLDMSFTSLTWLTDPRFHVTCARRPNQVDQWFGVVKNVKTPMIMIYARHVQERKERKASNVPRYPNTH